MVPHDLPCPSSSSFISAIGRLTGERKDAFEFIQQITDNYYTHLTSNTREEARLSSALIVRRIICTSVHLYTTLVPRRDSAMVGLLAQIGCRSGQLGGSLLQYGVHVQ